MIRDLNTIANERRRVQGHEIKQIHASDINALGRLRNALVVQMLIEGGTGRQIPEVITAIRVPLAECFLHFVAVNRARSLTQCRAGSERGEALVAIEGRR